MSSLPRIVVGTDGSPAGTAAVRWAATEAWLRDAELSVLTYPERMPGARRPVGTQVDAAVAEVRAIAPHIAMRGEPVSGAPAATLLAAARDADLVVVADSGRGGIADLRHGPVSVHVATH